MKAPLYEAVAAHNRKNMLSMHMPAHKGVSEILGLMGDIQRFDVTEIPDTGSLFDGEGATARAEELAAKAFGTRASFMSAGGCTLCIQAMLRAAAPNGGKIICSRVIHRSAINAMALLGLEPIWLLPDGSAGEGFSGRITAQAAEKALREHPDAAGVYITSPDYFGVMSDVGGIALAAAEYRVPLLVDNAHGAHLHCLSRDLSPTALGAAMSADSAHKTLPVLTGGAWLQVGDARFVGDIRSSMALFGSTSPSYPIMISLDLARAWLEEAGRAALAALCSRVSEAKSLCLSLGLSLPRGECDPARIAFDASPLGFSGSQFGYELRRMGVEPEYAGAGRVILIPSAMNGSDDFERLCSALKSICEGRTAGKTLRAQFSSLPAVAMPPAAAVRAQSEHIAVSESAGRIAAEVFCPCPPAIPVVMPGEVIDEEAISKLELYGIFDIKVVK